MPLSSRTPHSVHEVVLESESNAQQHDGDGFAIEQWPGLLVSDRGLQQTAPVAEGSNSGGGGRGGGEDGVGRGDGTETGTSSRYTETEAHEEKEGGDQYGSAAASWPRRGGRNGSLVARGNTDSNVDGKDGDVRLDVRS